MTGSKEYELASLISNPVFQSAVSSLLVAQLIKSIISLLRSREANLKEVLVTFFWKTGGMPSSHSALAISVTVAIALTEGFTNLFVLALFFALVVVRDAMGVRRAAGLQARALNRLGNELAARQGIGFKPVKEVHGHSTPEVAVGAALGFFIALAFCTL